MAKRSKKKKVVSSVVSAKAINKVNSAAPLPSWFSRDWLWGLILVLAVNLAYQPVWYAGFFWDDEGLVTANPCIVGPLGLKEIWTTSAADICPLTLTMFWLEHALWGLAPLPYHLVNVLMHGACAVVLWRILLSLRVPGAWLGAALWALHPVQIESVAWITETKNTESGLFFLLSILFFLRWLRARDLDGRTGGSWNYALTLFFAALAMASKSSTVILPVVLCLCAWWTEGRWQWRNLMKVGPIFLMAIAAGVLSIWTQGLQLATVTNPQFVRTWPERLVAAGDSVWFYLGKLLWPHPLIAIYPRWKISAAQWVSYLPLLAVMIVLFILWLKKESWSRPSFFIFAYFLAALLPMLGLADNYIFQYSLVFDHFQYLASMGPLALAGAGMVRWTNFAFPRRPWLQSIFGTGLLLVLGLLSWHRAWAFESDETLWTDTLAKNPSCWAGYNNLGNALRQTGRAAEAIEQYKQALRINPDYAEAHNNLGNALQQTGRAAEAIEQYKQALRINPDYAEAHNNLGNVLMKAGRVEEAMDQFEQALKLKPDFAEGHYDLGLLLGRAGNIKDAIDQFELALKLKPDYAEANNNLGIVLAKTGRMPEAMDQFEQALRLKPDYAEAHYDLGLLLEQAGRISEAVDQFEQALRIQPDDAEAHYNLGNSLIMFGRIPEAIEQYQQALKLKPDYAEAHNNLGVALENSNQAAEAIEQYLEALRINPNNADARNNLMRVQDLQEVAPARK